MVVTLANLTVYNSTSSFSTIKIIHFAVMDPRNSDMMLSNTASLRLPRHHVAGGGLNGTLLATLVPNDGYYEYSSTTSDKLPSARLFDFSIPAVPGSCNSVITGSPRSVVSMTFH